MSTEQRSTNTSADSGTSASVSVSNSARVSPMNSPTSPLKVLDEELAAYEPAPSPPQSSPALRFDPPLPVLPSEEPPFIDFQDAGAVEPEVDLIGFNDNTFRDEILEPPPISEALSSNSDDAILAPYEPSSEPAPAPKKKSKKPKRGLASPSEQPLILATQQPGAEVYPTSSQPAEEVRPTEPPASLKLWDAPVIDRREDSLPRHQPPADSYFEGSKQRTIRVSNAPSYKAAPSPAVVSNTTFADTTIVSSYGYRREDEQVDRESRHQAWGRGYDDMNHRRRERDVTALQGHSRSTSLGGYAANAYAGEGVSPTLTSPIGARSRRGAGFAGAGEMVMGAGAKVGGILAGMGGISASRSVGGASDAAGSIGGIGSGPARSRDFDEVLWARWDTVRPGNRLLLLLGYARGMQIWDCTDLSTVREVFNTTSNDLLSGEDGRRHEEAWGRVTHAAVLPSPGNSDIEDVCEGQRPVIGIVTTIQDEPTFIIYSLYRHCIVRKFVFPGLDHFQANESYIVLSTVNPATLHILSATSLETLSSIPSSSLAPFARKLATSATPPPPNLYNNTTPLHPIYDNANIPSYNTSNTNISTNINTNKIGSVLLSQFTDDRSAEYGPPRPVFALSNRLLAFASPAPLQRAMDPGARPSGRARSASRTSPLNQPTTIPSANTTALSQGHTALSKVGGTMLSGMRTLGGMAYSAAKAAAEEQLRAATSNESHAGGNEGGGPGRFGGTVGSFASKFFSRSAPAASGTGDGVARGRRYSTASSSSAASEGTDSSKDVAPVTKGGITEKGYFVTVVDLKPLLSMPRRSPSSRPSSPRHDSPPIISKFLASRHQPIVDLRFSSDATSILVSPKDGQTLQVFKLRPKSMAIRRLSGKIGRSVTISPEAPTDAPTSATQRRHPASLQMTTASPGSSRSPSTAGSRGELAVVQDPPLQVYNLKRGRTTAIVEEMEWADDERWIAIGTRKRTIHLFAINPYGGPPEIMSHLSGAVRNTVELQPLSIDVHPIVRLRAQKPLAVDQHQAPIVFTFFKPSTLTLPSHLLPAPVSSPRQSHVGSLGSTPESDYSSLRQTDRPRNYQDILVFDPADGMLSLRRVTIETKSLDEGIGLRGLPASVPILGSTSISLPKIGPAGRLSSSPGGAINTISNLQPSRSPASPGNEASVELVGKERTAATWNLRRDSDRLPARKSLAVRSDFAFHQARVRVSKNDWLAQAELSIHSLSTKIIPRSIYLSHQFTFQSLGEDYHALIRRYRFDVGGAKIEVRREVEAIAFAAETSESFVEGFAPRRDVRRASSSFDEPLASALGAGIESGRAPPVLPMLPNGAPRSGPKSIRNAIPIRSISDNMSEGIGRIRTQFQQRVRSPRGGDIGSGATPLEFAEEDEESQSRDSLLDKGIIIRGGNRHSGTTLSTPSVHGHPSDDDGDADELWRAWESQDKLAIEEVERFDDISVVGLLDEEQVSMNQKSKPRGRKQGR
ncbi:hypothetical protein CCMSSC00406_0010187 [Pleurotus cornucopiae]|uniref:Uncharacterized protein n=1 Tax=Pleurotus cornucopiae TaxID=5321 RepID=A0ACB7IPP1_PLECO|nr:hypothetical protein CCMSSC00406_0010187 [Pleurotus cornucopiae]